VLIQVLRIKSNQSRETCKVKLVKGNESSYVWFSQEILDGNCNKQDNFWRESNLKLKLIAFLVESSQILLGKSFHSNCLSQVTRVKSCLSNH
jgi:hypothetical protein